MEQFDDPTHPGNAFPQHPVPPPEEHEGFDADSILSALDVTLAHAGQEAGAPAPPAAPEAFPIFEEHAVEPPPLDPVPAAGLGPTEASPERFELLGVLGRGGMGKVFRACDRQIEGRRVALKVLHPNFSADTRFRELFFQEIRAAQGFVSEHVCQVRDTGQMVDGSIFLTMDLVLGEPLSRVLRREGSLVPRHAFEIAAQILRGLQSGHEHGLVHRDVKPSNVMLEARVPKTEENPYGVGVRLLDFGIAGLAENMRSGERCGTPSYMSPEAVQGQRLDARSDLFAVGVVLYEMLTGTRPFEGDSLREIETSLLETRVEPLVRQLKHVPRAIRKVLRKAMQKDREKRYQSAAEFLDAIERSKVLRPEGELAASIKGALTVLGIAAGAEATIIWQLYRKAGDLEAELATSTTVVQEEKDAEIALLRQRLDTKASELTLLQGRLLEEGDLGTKFVDLERDYSKLREESGLLQRRNEDLQRRIDALESVKREQEFSELPAAKTAACFDELLRRIDHGAGRSALEYLKGRSEAGIFAIDQHDGKELVYHLAHAAAVLESALRQENPSRLEEARKRLTEAEKEELNFRLEARSWLELTSGGGAPADRLSQLKRTLELLKERIEAASEKGATSRREAWSAIASAPADQDPAAAFAHAERFGPNSIGKLIGRYAAHLDRTVVKDGQLDLEALANETPLRHWGPWLEGPGGIQEGPLANRLRSYYCALEWYVTRAARPSFAELFASPPALGQDLPHHDWRAQLALQLELANSDAFPQPADSNVIMHHTWTRSGQVLWFLERLGNSTRDSWTIERRIHNPEGATTGRPQTFEITRTEDAFFTEGFRGLDLRSVSTDIRVGVFHPSIDRKLPRKPWVQEMDTQGYRRAIRTAAVPCLVVRSESRELWFSPRFGLVREVRSGVYEREQVHFSSYR